MVVKSGIKPLYLPFQIFVILKTIQPRKRDSLQTLQVRSAFLLRTVQFDAYKSAMSLH